MRPGIYVTTLALGVFMAVTGCTTPTGEFSQTSDNHRQELERWQEHMNKPRDARVRITDIPSAGERIKLQKHRWLADKQVTLNVAKGAPNLTAHTIAQMLKDQGIQVMSSLPLEGYKYNGFGVKNVDGVTALRLLLAPMGLDYDINDESQYVVITPNRTRTFYVKLGERTTEYESGSMSGNVGSGGGSGGSSGGSSSGSSGSSDSGGAVSGVETGLTTGTGKISVEGDFWTAINNELNARMTQCVPAAIIPAPITANIQIPGLQVDTMGALPGMQGMQGMAGMGGMMSIPAAEPTTASACVEQKVGTYSMNPTTGAISVQAPHWVLEEVSSYLDTVRSDNAVTLIYEGMLISITTSRDKQEGVDLEGFFSFAQGELGMIVSNNALGGVTISGGSAAVGGEAVAGTLVGVQKLGGNPAQAFLAYLEANANFSITQRPRVAATNGVPSEFAQYDTLYYNRLSQEAAGGDSSGSALIGTTNELIPFKVGALLRIVPYYDSDSGVVRSPITFSQSVQTGSYETVQYVTGSSGSVERIPSVIPLIRDSNYSGEVLMKDGDLLIIGGQVTESSESSGSGLPGYNRRNNPISGLMGMKRHNDSVSTYYLALTLRVRN